MTTPAFARLPWYPRDFASSTRGWPLLARAVYRELLDAQWDQGGSTGPGTLPVDEDLLRAMVGASLAQWKTAWPLVEPKFPIDGGGRRNARLEVHRDASIRQHQARQNGAKATNDKRWGYGR